MSTGAECEFVEVQPGKWYYVLEETSAPKNAWDWREYAHAYGPFPTFEVADRHLHDHHANPGGYDEEPYHDGLKLDDVMQKLIAEATL